MTKRPAFTLIETLAAVALAAVLLVVSFQIVAGVGRAQWVMTQRDAAADWADGVLDVIRGDVLNARRVRVENGTLRLDGYNALDPQTLSPSGRLASVVYRVQDIAGRRWLVRSQTLDDALTNAARTSQPLCPDVAQLAVVATRRKGDEPDAMPARVAVRIVPNDPAAMPAEEVIFVR